MYHSLGMVKVAPCLTLPWNKCDQAMEKLVPGSKLYFCLLLAGKNPVEFLTGTTYLRALVTSATLAQKGEI
ncbi:hypothetical protein NIES4071_92950 [Calothrix sp. NIES-4071]|nr:hypothetical protein NIES4071_92950 [Calothrix sp. NIES-4071]BAZ63562.1 hypothetical protein NIES4105_92880 [Calothrix sp. NIES-4105]